MLNPSGDAPAHFLKELYGEDEEVEIEYEEVEIMDIEEEAQIVSDDDDENDPSSRSSSPAAPPYSPLTTPDRRQVQRERSRSPILIGDPSSESLASSGIVLRIYDEAESPLEDVVDDELEAFMSPDAHDLYTRVEGTANVAATSPRRKDGRRRARRGRGPMRSRGEGLPQWITWQVGHPLQEIWMTDDDVPVELRELARDVVRRRQTSTTSRIADNDDVFYDAVDGRGNPLLPDARDLHFDWFPMETFQGEEETFKPQHTGSVTSYTNPYDAFRSFWDDEILRVVVDATNRYASKIKSPSFQSDWYPTNSHELLCLFAFWMMSGIIRMPTICSYFSQNHLLKTEIFTRITTLKRYNNLNRALHFVDTNPASGAAYTTNSGIISTDRVHHLRSIIDHLNSKFKANYILSKDICIDESLTLWKGRLSFKQFIKSKAAKFGIKTFELCESATGYLWSFIVYTGKSQTDSTLSKSTEIVCNLIRPLLNKGYRLFMDNWFNSPLLARYLKRNGTDCVGTLRPNRQHVPKLVTQAPLKQGQLIARHSGDVCVLSWQDKKKVNMISTCHGSATGLSMVASHPPTRPLPYKPQAVLDYNRSMGGIDLKDQMLEPYLLERKRCAKWYLKLFKRLLNCSIHNSRILLESSLKARQDNLKFRLELVDTILSLHLSLVPLGRRAEASHRRSSTILHSHITNNTHWPVKVQTSGWHVAHNRQGRQRCVLCAKAGRKNQKTPYKCEACDVPLCIETCFKSYHTTVS